MPTIVTFPTGTVTGDGVIARVEQTPEGTIVVVDETPFHPVDHTWPDQPGDTGSIAVGDDTVRVVEAVMAAISDEGEFAVGSAIPVKRGAEGWTWLVGHLIEGAAPASFTEGARADLTVDAARRAGLSRGHTACHVASLALDLALADLWRKEPGRTLSATPTSRVAPTSPAASTKMALSTSTGSGRACAGPASIPRPSPRPCPSASDGSMSSSRHGSPQVL